MVTRPAPPEPPGAKKTERKENVQMKTSYAHHKLDTARANKQKTAEFKKVCKESQAKTAWIHFSDDNQPLLKISSHPREVVSLLHATNHRTPGLEGITDAEMVNSAER